MREHQQQKKEAIDTLSQLYISQNFANSGVLL